MTLYFGHLVLPHVFIVQLQLVSFRLGAPKLLTTSPTSRQHPEGVCHFPHKPVGGHEIEYYVNDATNINTKINYKIYMRYKQDIVRATRKHTTQKSIGINSPKLLPVQLVCLPVQ